MLIVTLRLVVYRQSVRLGTTSPLRLTTSNYSYSPYVTCPLTRDWVCHLQSIPVLTSTVILRSESRGTRYHILQSQIRDSTNLEGQVPVFQLSHFRDSPNLEGQVPVFLSPRKMVAQLYHTHWVCTPIISNPQFN
jgi:hypothetical protein